MPKVLIGHGNFGRFLYRICAKGTPGSGCLSLTHATVSFTSITASLKGTAIINTSNPIVDRIMDDDSVEGVIMTNKEGAPILTNVSVTSATNYGRGLHKFGALAQMYVKELNPLEEIMIIRIHTKKNEIIMAPDDEFNIVVIQHARPRHKLKDKRKDK